MLVSMEKYPADSILKDYPLGIYDNIGINLIKKWERALVSFHVRKPFHRFEVETVGTGFLFENEGVVGIYTASHVIKQIMDDKTRTIRINDSFYLLSNVNVFYEDTQDYAIVELPKEAMNGQRIVAFPLAQRNDLNLTKSFMIFGYPANKNVLRLGKQHLFNTLNIFRNDFKYDTETEDIFFEFNKKDKYIYEPDSSFKSLPALNGMSGSPVVQIMINKNTEALTLRVIGIFKIHRHNDKEKYLIGSTLTNFADEVNTMISLGVLT